MADRKISALTNATTPLAGTEVLPIVQSGATVKVSIANLTAGRAVAMAGGSFTDNITQSTAAKGVNFTANTPGVGMTSQLLNWYEEGTFTPVFTALTVVNGSGGATYSGRYTRVGRTVNFQVIIAVTGSCTTEATNGATRFTTLFTIAQDSTAGFTFLRAASIGVGTCDSVTNFVWCPAWAATNNNVIISGSYEV